MFECFVLFLTQRRLPATDSYQLNCSEDKSTLFGVLKMKKHLPLVRQWEWVKNVMLPFSNSCRSVWTLFKFVILTNLILILPMTFVKSVLCGRRDVNSFHFLIQFIVIRMNMKTLTLLHELIRTHTHTHTISSFVCCQTRDFLISTLFWIYFMLILFFLVVYVSWIAVIHVSESSESVFDWNSLTSIWSPNFRFHFVVLY